MLDRTITRSPMATGKILLISRDEVGVEDAW